MKLISIQILLFVFLGMTTTLSAQVSKFIGISFGINGASMRDFATSPLTYRGQTLQLGLSRYKISDKKEVELGFLYDSGKLSTNFNDNLTSTQLKRLELNYSRLYSVGFLASESINTKVGFMLNGIGNLRINSALQNNAVGLEAFANIFGSIKVTKDISRKQDKEKRFLFWKYTRKARKRNLALRLNVGVVNSSFRNGYVYANQTPVLNDTKPFDDYQYNIFSGFRASTSIDYTCYLNNNAIRFSYVWDAYRTSGEADVLEMSNRTIKMVLLFNTNNPVKDVE